MPIIEVPGHGQVEFPDNMSEQEITAAIQKNMPQQQQQSQFSQQHPVLQALGNFFGGAAQGAVNTGLMASKLTSPLPSPIDSFQMPGVEQNALSTTLGELASPIGGALKAAGKPAVALASKLTGKEANTLAKNLYEKLAGKMDEKDLNAMNMGHILNNFDKNIQKGSEKFTNFLNEGEKAGYLSDVQQGVAGISSPTSAKFIKENSDLSNSLDKISKEKISDTLKNAISSFRNNPSLRNSHDMQSALFKESQDWMGSLKPTPEEKEIANLLKSTRQDTLNSIKGTLEKNGDKDLLNMFKDARDNWKQTVIPYSEIRTINRAQKGGDLPVNTLKLLEKQSKDNKYDVIRKDLAANPEQSQSLLAQILAKHAKRDALGNITEVPAEDILKSYSGTSNTLKNLLSDDLKNQMSQIEKSKKVAEKAEKYTILPRAYKAMKGFTIGK